MGVEGLPLGWKVGAGPGSPDPAWCPLCTADCSVARWGGGAEVPTGGERLQHPVLTGLATEGRLWPV